MGAYTQSLGLLSPASLAEYRSTHQVEHWPLDDASGPMSGVGGKDLTVVGSPSFNQTGGAGGNGLEFTATTGQYIYRNNADIQPGVNDDYFMELWFKTTDNGAVRNLATITTNLSFGNPNNFVQLITGDSARVGYDSATVASNFTDVTFASTGNNHHLGWGVKKHGTGYYEQMVYIDGVKLSALQDSANPTTADHFVVGRLAGDNCVQALIDNLRFYKGTGAFPSDAIIAAMAAEY